MFPPSKRIKLTEDFSEPHARVNCPLAETIRNPNQNREQSSTSGSSKMTLSPPSNPEAARAARQKAMNDRMPNILALSRRLQSALDISDSAPRQIPLTPSTFPQPNGRPVWMNGVRLRASLRLCTNFAVDMNRKSESLEFLDRKILSESGATASAATESGTKRNARHDQVVGHGMEDTSETVMTDMEDKIPTLELLADSKQSSPHDFDPADRFVNDSQAVSQVDIIELAERVSHKVVPKASLQPSTAFDSATVATELTTKHPEIQALSSSPVKYVANANHGIEDTITFGNRQIENTTIFANVDLKDDTSSPIEELVPTDLAGDTGLGITTTSAVTATTVSGENEITVQANKENPRPSKKWPIFSVPDPMKMPGTFTTAICHQQDFHVAPLLTLTLRGTTPLVEYSATQRSQILLHLEVGLDDVEAMCQGTFTIDDSSYWEDNLCEQDRLQKSAKARGDSEAQSQGMEQHQIKKGSGQGRWVFFGVRFQQTIKDKQNGNGGRWACFGVPLQSCSPVTRNAEAATFGGGCDSEGTNVPQYLAKVWRLEYRVSTGGIACMDLWQNADEWRGGVWSQVKQAMADNSLIVCSLHAT